MPCNECDLVNERLGIDIELFFHDLASISIERSQLNNLDRQIICASLLGQDRHEITNTISINSSSYVRDRLSDRIYPTIGILMSVDLAEVRNKWLVILNWLLDPAQKYRLHPPAQLNADNFQASFGRQVFLYAHDRQIGNAQIRAANYYQSGSWYFAQRYFLAAWHSGRELFQSGSPEILIYINNCAIERHASQLRARGISIRTIAIVVPIYHDNGQIAAQTLQGIAQIQLQINVRVRELELDNIFPDISRLDSGSILAHESALKISIVNDINNLYDGHDRTAENLTRLASSLNLMAVIGHYSSEATQRALPVYAQAEMVLVNSSSTSDRLSLLEIGDELCFFRIPPRDAINAASLVSFLGDPRSFPALPQLKKVSIIYDRHSIYSNSYRQAVEDELKARQDRFQTISTFGYISEEDIRSSNYIEQINSAGVDIVIIVIDARIDPNFLANTGLLSELNLDRCILAGSATLYKQNFNRSIANPQAQIVSCVPWHWNSLVNGCNSNRSHASNFCALAERLWGEQKVTWRSATAFDSVLLLYRIFQQFPDISDARSLSEYMHRHYKVENIQVEGVTGTISFQANGDRLNPPTEIVKLEWHQSLKQWQWQCISHS